MNIMDINKLKYTYDPRVLEDGVKRAFDIDKENMELLKKLYIILRSNGITDCWRKEIVNKNIDERYDIKKWKKMKKNDDKFETDADIYPTSGNNIKRNSNNNRSLFNNKSKLPSLKTSNITTMNKNNKNSIKLLDKYQLKMKNDLIIQKYPRCYFKLQINEPYRYLGKIIFQLYHDIVPITCKNFMGLCTGVNGLSYKNTPLHRIISGYMCQGGDVIKLNGSDGKSIYGGDFDDENFKLKHSLPGMLSMYNSGINTNNSKFNLTFKKLAILDGKNVVFGKIIDGLSIIYEIDAIGTKIGKPKRKIIISDCGLC